MAIIRKKDIQRMNKTELVEKLRELELEKLKASVQKGQAAAGAKKTSEIKRTIARINTQLKQTKE
jgi:ribosomal protein L29